MHPPNTYAAVGSAERSSKLEVTLLIPDDALLPSLAQSFRSETSSQERTLRNGPLTSRLASTFFSSGDPLIQSNGTLAILQSRINFFMTASVSLD
mmetsp:Transcript_7711/g.10053  ORF Transcript_7711/g.10053 Transcript_7711/m.10053 type:complete len:95 (+) Transcript_7711:163-447(+)